MTRHTGGVVKLLTKWLQGPRYRAGHTGTADRTYKKCIAPPSLDATM